jgi:hypothetical protein
MQRATFTAREIAERIKQPDELISSALNRLKNWTNEGLITPIGDWHPGTGKKRLYREHALLDAVLLQTLTECTGVTAVQAAPLLAKSQKHIVSTMEDGTLPNSVLLISRSIGGREPKISSGKSSSIAKLIADAGPHDTHTVINLKMLFDRASLERA